VTKCKVSPYEIKWHLNFSLGFGKVNIYFVLITALKAKAFGRTAFRILLCVSSATQILLHRRELNA